VIGGGSMRTTNVTIDKDDFLEFLGQAAEVESLTFSTNPAREVWPCDGDGYSKDSRRRYIEAPAHLLKAAIDEYLNWREEGGRFRIDFFGVYCHIERGYLIRWIKSADLVLYQGSTPTRSEEWIDLWRMMANCEQKECSNDGFADH
jgi:hypothetical protein